MEKVLKGSDLSRALVRTSVTLHGTLSLLDGPATSAAEKVAWVDVTKVAERTAKHATTVGLLGTDFKDTVEAVRAYLDTLQGLILLAHGSTVGAGPTLLGAVRQATTHVVEASLSLLDLAVALAIKGADRSEREARLPTAVGHVWESCGSLKKVPPDNRAAIGRGLVQVASSMKDVVREIAEVKESSLADETGMSSLSLEGGDDRGIAVPVSSPSRGQDGDEGSGSEDVDFGEDFSQEEMGVVKAASPLVDTLTLVLKQLLYIVADKASDTPVEAMERLLLHSKSLGVHVDELGASLYPPQELDQLRNRLRLIEDGVHQVQMEVKGIRGSIPEDLRVTGDKAQSSLAFLRHTLDAADPQLV